MLGQFDLVGIPPAPRGVPQVEVTFDIDANGIVQVSAKDKATGKEQQIKIQASGGLSDADIDQMVKDAEVNADEDKKMRETVEVRNQAESLIHQTEKTIADLGDKVPEEDRLNAENAMEDLKSVLEGKDKKEIEDKTNALMEASMKLGELAYQQAQDEAAGDPDNADNDSDNVAEADVVDEDDVIDLEMDEDDKDQKSA